MYTSDERNEVIDKKAKVSASMNTGIVNHAGGCIYREYSGNSERVLDSSIQTFWLYMVTPMVSGDLWPSSATGRRMET